jgi:hypothetical protein
MLISCLGSLLPRVFTYLILDVNKVSSIRYRTYISVRDRMLCWVAG